MVHGSVSAVSVMFTNRDNWRSALNIFLTIRRPLRFIVAIALGKTLAHVSVRTPVGRVRIALRNHESLKTLFSIFCRGDYSTDSTGPYFFMDVGANVGIASAYFLSRNPLNVVTCFEPDPANLKFLRETLSPFAERSQIHDCAIGTAAGVVTFFRSENGKYSSLVESKEACLPQTVECRRFADELQTIANGRLPVVVKLDVEGTETDLARSVNWDNYPSVKRLICDSIECGAVIERSHKRVVHNRLFEDILFLDSPLVKNSAKVTPT
jgi:FkbM family methyltransferase